MQSHDLFPEKHIKYSTFAENKLQLAEYEQLNEMATSRKFAISITSQQKSDTNVCKDLGSR